MLHWFNNKSRISCLIIKILIYILLLLFTFSCDSEKEDKQKISGIVMLENLDDEQIVTDGVQILIYDAEINDSWDYRLETPILVTTTDSYGEFSVELDDLSEKAAVILYPTYSVTIIEDLHEDMGITLYEDIVIHGGISYDVVVSNKNNLVISEDCYFLEGSSFTVENGSIVRIECSKNIFFNSWVNINSNCRIMSNDKVYSYSNDSILNFSSIVVGQTSQLEDNKLSNLTLYNTNYGIKIYISAVEVSNCRIYKSEVGFYFNNVDNIIVDNCLFENNTTNDGALYMDMVNHAIITNNIFLQNSMALKVKEGNNFIINNNNFRGNEDSFISYNFTGEIHNNTFIGGNTGLTLIGSSYEGFFEIKRNNFECNIGIKQQSLGSYNRINTLLINDNNFYECEDFYFLYSAAHFNDNIDATNNYFNDDDSEIKIREKIMSYKDHPSLNIEVEIIPFLTEPINGSGCDLCD